MSSGTEKAGTEHNVRAIDEDGLDQRRVLTWIVLEIGILDQYQRGRCLRDASP